MPTGFPVAAYETVYRNTLDFSKTDAPVYAHFTGAWNAVAYRFLAVVDYQTALDASIVNRAPKPLIRHQQEKDLFGFFSSGFAVFESIFYALFSIGAFASPPHFPMTSSRDQSKIGPATATAAFNAAWPSDAINNVLRLVTSKPSFLEWREIRNILTHRATPGRTVFVSFVDDAQSLPDEWKIKNISLDVTMARSRRAALSGLLSDLLPAIEDFTRRHFEGACDA